MTWLSGDIHGAVTRPPGDFFHAHTSCCAFFAVIHSIPALFKNAANRTLYSRQKSASSTTSSRHSPDSTFDTNDACELKCLATSTCVSPASCRAERSVCRSRSYRTV